MKQHQEWMIQWSTNNYRIKCNQVSAREEHAWQAHWTQKALWRVDFPLEGTCSKSELWRSYCQPCQAAFVADAIRSYYIYIMLFRFFRYPWLIHDTIVESLIHLGMWTITNDTIPMPGGRMAPLQPISRQQCRVGFSKKGSSLFLGETESWSACGRGRAKNAFKWQESVKMSWIQYEYYTHILILRKAGRSSMATPLTGPHFQKEHERIRTRTRPKQFYRAQLLSQSSWGRLSLLRFRWLLHQQQAQDKRGRKVCPWQRFWGSPELGPSPLDAFGTWTMLHAEPCRSILPSRLTGQPKCEHHQLVQRRPTGISQQKISSFSFCNLQLRKGRRMPTCHFYSSSMFAFTGDRSLNFVVK